MKQKIEEKLRNNIKIEFLEIENKSYLHKGHAGDNGSGETHFRIIVESNELRSLSRINAHKKINKFLREEFANGLHALEINIR